MRTFAKLSAVIMALAVITGCWDRLEINDVAFVVGTAIDMKDGQYIMSAQFPLPSQLGGQSGGGGGTAGDKSWYIDSAAAPTLSEAVDRQQQSLSRKLFFGHRRVLIIGEEVARSGLTPIMDIVSRLPQNRLTTFIVIAEGEGRDLLNTKAPLENVPAEMVRELAVNSMRQPRMVRHVLNTILTDGVDPALPLFAVKKTSSGQLGKPVTTIERTGLAVFRGDRLAGIIKGEKADGVLWAMGEAEDITITVQVPEGEGKMSLRFPRGEAQVQHMMKDGKVQGSIIVKATGSVVENESNYSSIAESSLHAIETRAAAKIKQMMDSGMNELQKKYKSDATGIGESIYRKDPKLWTTLEKDWHQIYSEMEVVTLVSVQIEHTGTIMKPIAAGRKNRSGD